MSSFRSHVVHGSVHPAYDAWLAEVATLCLSAGVLVPESTDRIACFELGLTPIRTVRAHRLILLAGAARTKPRGDA